MSLCVAVCCNDVLQCVTVVKTQRMSHLFVLQCVTVCCGELLCAAVCCSALQ